MKAIRKIFIVALMLSLILTVATAVAADDMTFNQGDSNETINIEHTQNDYLTGKDSEDYPLSTQDKKPGSFHDLQMLIDNSSGVINLERDYAYNDTTDRYLTIHDKSYGGLELFVESDTGIKINKSIQINGNGHSIDARNMTRIFNIIADNVVLKNITFLNANCYNPHGSPQDIFIVGGELRANIVVYDSGKFHDESMHSVAISLKGGAIYCKANGLKITDSTFKGNIADNGGAIYIDGSDSQLSNLSFSNNTAYDGGALYVRGKATILQSKFDSNHGSHAGSSILSSGEVNIQNCTFTNSNRRNVVLYGKWQIDNMNSTYYNSFVKFTGGLDFKYELTPSHGEYHNLKITFGIRLYSLPNRPLVNDDYGYSNNKSFCMDVNGKVYNLRTDENSQSELNLKIPNGYITLKAYNPITNRSVSKSFNFGPYMYNHTSVNIEKSKKSPSKLIAKGKVFNKKLKTKRYSIVLKGSDNEKLKKAWVSLKINGKLFKAKTNKYGKATFKIKLNKKGTFKAKITFKGNKNYTKTSKTVKIKIR